jgi:phenylacetic acid degradation operon negative regulatory protein
MKRGTGNRGKLLLEFLASFVRRTDDWVPVAALVELMSDIGIDHSSVRTGVSRLKQRGWLISEKRADLNGYRIGEKALDRFRAGDSVIWHAREPAELDNGWAIVAFSVPEAQRAQRHLLRSRLAALGFGNTGPGLAIAPARMMGEAEEVLDEFDLRRYSDLFMAHYRERQDINNLVERGWDLAGLNARYLEFVEAWTPVIDAWTDAGTPESDREAFVDYSLALSDWRPLPFLDPGLPAELLLDDWAGFAARALFERIVDTLGDAAMRHVEARLASVGYAPVADAAGA